MIEQYTSPGLAALQLLVAEAEAVHHPGAEVLDDHVGLARERQRALAGHRRICRSSTTLRLLRLTDWK